MIVCLIIAVSTCELYEMFLCNWLASWGTEDFALRMITSLRLFQSVISTLSIKLYFYIWSLCCLCMCVHDSVFVHVRGYSYFLYFKPCHNWGQGLKGEHGVSRPSHPPFGSKYSQLTLPHHHTSLTHTTTDTRALLQCTHKQIHIVWPTQWGFLRLKSK